MFKDLKKQGFMRMANATSQRPKKVKKIIACDRCHDWHWEGKHVKKERSVTP
jgi:hypothetical protein